jgi:hypothetical protein
MAQCYEYFQAVAVSTSVNGLSIYPVNVDLSLCMSAPVANPWGYAPIGHFIAFNSAEYMTLIDLNSVISVCSMAVMFGLGFIAALWAF